MNRYLCIIIISTLLSCGPSKTTVSSITENSIKTSLKYLASDELEGRNTGSKGIEKAAVFIENILKESNIEPYFETYRDSFNIKDIVGYNIVGYLKGNDPKLKNEFVILGAHYDHIGTAKEFNGDVIANGANDNASGTSGVLEIAKYLATKKNNKRSVIIALFSAEEKGLIGSKHLAKKLKSENLNLYSMINFEMIGEPMKGKNYMVYVTGHNTSNLAEKFNEYTQDSTFIGYYEMAETYKLFERSDNYPFYQEFNVSSQTFSTSDDYEYYHHVDDETDKINFDHMTKFIDKISPALQKMINTPTQEIELTKNKK